MRARHDPPPPHRERGLDTAPAPDWSVIDQRIAAALAQQTKRIAALEERIALLDECSHQLAQAVADTFDTIDKALERLESLYRPRAIVSEVIDGGSQLPTARPELTLPTVYSAPGECPLASGFALAPFPGKP